MVGQKPVSRRCFGIAFVSRRPPVMMDWAAFSFSRLPFRSVRRFLWKEAVSTGKQMKNGLLRDMPAYGRLARISLKRSMQR
ncbi:hypothetical protein CN070_23045 [Sinorhizobium meliloti]|nr:hypothetical protein CN070_23045 [Sinorhizobium meliloti]